MKKKLLIIILAAGYGTRMKSNTPKVLHKIGNIPLLEHIMRSVDNIKNFDITKCVVVGPEMINNTKFKKITDKYNCEIAIQEERLGTGHAVSVAIKDMENKIFDDVLVLYGDVPLFKPESIEELIKSSENSIATATTFNHYGDGKYGKIQLNKDGNIIGIVEHNDLTEHNKTNLCNAGPLIVKYKTLVNFLAQLLNSNTKELYLTDIFSYNSDKNCNYIMIDESEAIGVNDRIELANAELIFQNRMRKKMMESGVTLIAPETVFFSSDTILSQDVVVHPYVRFGLNVTVGEGSEIKSFSDIEGVKIGNNTTIGPFARIRSNSEIGDNCRIGNFVEIKNADIADNAKASHHSYLGDVSIGNNTKIGAGTIFCNYDGKNKHHTTVGKNTMIGANTSIISPKNIGDNAVIGAGSVITEDVYDNEIAVARAKQVNKRGR